MNIEMDSKKNILESWIMVEHLSEGDIRPENNKEIFRFDKLQGDDFYSFFNENIKIPQYKNSGLVIYFDIFKFKDTIDFLRDEYRLEECDEDIQYGDKFSFALYFDKELNFDKDKTFFTASGYIRYFKKIPTLDEFRKCENDFKDKLTQCFENGSEDLEDKALFNTALSKCFKEYNIAYENCRFQILNNLETEANNLHSFFLDDLIKAKNIETNNLTAYLLGGDLSKRVNLDSKNDSENFNPDCFKKILHPTHYPLGRFPSKTAYALSFMQQVAVNLAISYDNQTIRSVNGPPGTGKTTLLKDIFAELIVQQSYDIAKMEKKEVIGSDETKYYDNAKIGRLPKHIAEKGIVVASSNNGAVQNIVNELPLIKKEDDKYLIDEALIKDLIEADYFKEISNHIFRTDWPEDESGKKVNELKKEKLGKEDNFWGLISLEGGKSENITKIINYLKAIFKYLNEEYQSDDKVYESFQKQYEKVQELRNSAIKMIEIEASYNCVYKKLNDFYIQYTNGKADNKIKEERLEKIIADKIEKLENLNIEISALSQKVKCLTDSKEERKALLNEKKQNKPGFFDFTAKKEYKNEVNALINKLSALQNDLDECQKEERNTRNKRDEIQKNIRQAKLDLKDSQRSFEDWIKFMNNEEINLTTQLDQLGDDINKFQNKWLNMAMPYEELQLFNPWFDEAYRIEQSKLFISALKVRKQFLYENRKNLKVATFIWENQKNYLENKLLIEIAWSWINLAIPVISSTFASFSRMCKHLGAETMGHLFIDEAGQALPQAAVGAIFRSKQVMLVGDPSQIKPVLTLDSKVLNLLSQHYRVGKKYLSESASAQTLADATSQYGFYRDSEQSEESWIGIPLWVHRRCQYPMFTISNVISYDGLMVQGTKSYGKTGWYDVQGKAQDKFVKEQGEFLEKEILKRLKEKPDLSIYVISPFRNVASKLAELLNGINFTKKENGKATNVGTIHTFQGKEASVVYLVLGADDQIKGAANWAVKEPNMMNVAATRAKEEFYIVGDKNLYANLGSDVVTKTLEVIENYKKEKPDLVNEIKIQEFKHLSFKEEIKERQGNTGQNLENQVDCVYEIPKENSDQSADAPPSCPLCAQKMRLRSGQYGTFWGCANFPRCKGTMSVRK